MQYPNGLLFFGALAVVYTLPYIEPEWEKFELERLNKEKEKKEKKLAKKLESKV